MNKVDSEVEEYNTTFELQDRVFSFIKNTTTAQIPRKVEMSMSDQEFNLLKNYYKEKNIEGFIENYKTQNQELLDDDIICLCLISAVKSHDIFLIYKILNVLYKKETTNPHPLVTLDKYGKNVILYSLEEHSCILQLGSYIFHLNEDNKITEKFSLEKDLLLKMVEALKHPPCETHPKLLIKELIKPIYTKESLEELIKEIGQDWLDSYYF